MGEVNRVTVKIAGKEYTISGEMSRDHIMRVADYVDGKIKEIGKMLPNATSVSLATLTAVNAADDYFTVLEETRDLRNRCAQLEKDSAHYVQLWDEAKKNFLQYKENAQSSLEHREQLQKLFNDKTVEYSRLSDAYEELKKQNQELRAQNEEMNQKLQAQEVSGVSSESAELISQLENKCKDIESSFFDLQMENIRLKGELDQFRKNL
ncbi:MAG: cell division protein ZapA [Firmicutes bacterium]|nr:cell division protein ZapA [Bacillota bacterium]